MAVNTNLPAGAAAFDPTTTSILFDEFLGGNDGTTAGAVGSLGNLGWAMSNLQGTNTDYANAGTTGHPGQIKITTGATLGDGTSMDLVQNTQTGGGTHSIGPANQGNWQINFGIQFGQTATNSIRFGVCSDTTGDKPTNGIYFEYDTTDSAAIRSISRAASTQTVAGATTAADTNWHSYKMVMNSAGTSITFYIDGISQGAVATNIPSAVVRPFLQIITRTTAAKSVTIDYFYWSMTGLSR